MRSGLVIAAVIAVLLGGTLFGVAGLVLLPLIGGVVLVALLIRIIQRQAAGKPPIR